MVTHTMIVSFDDPIPDVELDQFLTDMKQLVLGSELAQSFSSQHHIRVPADDHAPVFAASAIVQVNLADLDALNASFGIEGLEEFSEGWQSRHPYRLVWVNHQPLG